MVDVPFEGQVLKSRETGHSEMLSILHRFLSRLLIFSLVLKNCLHLLFSVLQLYSSGIVYDQVFNRSRNRRKIEEARFCGAIIKLFVFATRWQKPKGRFASFLLLSATSTRFIYFVLRFAVKLMRHCVKLETLLVLSHFPYNMISNAERSFPCNNSWKCCNSDVDLLFMFLQKGKICNFPTMMSVFIRECTCLFIDSVAPFAGNLKITIKHVIKCC